MAAINIVDSVKIQNDTNDLLQIDSITNSAYIIPVEHGYIHKGLGFFLSHSTIVDANNNYDILLINPTNNNLHLMNHNATAAFSPGEFSIYEDAIINDNGSSLTIKNSNRLSSNIPNATIYENPNINDIGYELDCDFIIGSKVSGGITSEISFEWILKQNSNYIFRYKNNSGIAADLNIKLFFLEV